MISIRFFYGYNLTISDWEYTDNADEKEHLISILTEDSGFEDYYNGNAATVYVFAETISEPDLTSETLDYDSFIPNPTEIANAKEKFNKNFISLSDEKQKLLKNLGSPRIFVSLTS